MLLPCICQCHGNLEVAMVIFGGRYRQETRPVWHVVSEAQARMSWSLKFSGAEIGVGENGAEAPNSAIADCSRAHRIMLVSVLIKVFQGQFEL